MRLTNLTGKNVVSQLRGVAQTEHVLISALVWIKAAQRQLKQYHLIEVEHLLSYFTAKDQK